MQQFKSLRRAGVPLAAIESADPGATIQECFDILKKMSEDYPVFAWDLIRGCRGLNKAAKAAIENYGDDLSPDNTMNPSEFLRLLRSKLEDKNTPLQDGVLFLMNGHRFIRETDILQAIWNLRDTCKAKHFTVVLLGPAVRLPEELKHDIVVLSEPLPGDKEISRMATSLIQDAGLKEELFTSNKERVIDTLRGLSLFAGETVLAMSLTKEGINMDDLWQRKRKMIEQTPGLEVWKGGESFDDLGGLANLKDFLTRVLTSGATPVRAIGFMDEIEKSLAGAAGDTSGTSQDQLGVILKVMNDKDIPGIILIGPGGTGKSAIAKAAGGVAQAPVISIDMGAMKGSLVGESEAKIRSAMDVFDAVSQGRGMFIATCNKISSLPPELRRRFTLGTFFVDLPSDEERRKIWALWLKRYALKEEVTDDIITMSKDWTGAEVRACCNVAFRTAMTVAEASKFVVPVIKSAPDQVDGLRKMAHGKFLSASRPGIYSCQQIVDSDVAEPVRAGRKVEV